LATAVYYAIEAEAGGERVLPFESIPEQVLIKSIGNGLSL
jgi:hypothetical protein